MRPTRRLALAALVTLGTLSGPAFAQDAPKDPAAPDAPDAPKEEGKPSPAAPKEGDAAKPAEPPKKERKVDPKAIEAIDKHKSMVHTPASLGAKEIVTHGEIDAMGSTITFKTTWAAEKSLRVSDVTLPEEVLAQFGDMASQIQEMASGQIQMIVGPTFGFVPKPDDYDVAFKAKDGGGAVIDLAPFNEKANFDSLRMRMGASGLLEQTVFTLRLPPEHPMAAQLAGVEFETSYQYEKKGEKHIVTGVAMNNPMGESTSKIEYYELNGTYLPKLVTATTAQGEQVVRFTDYVADGKPVEGTQKPKPAEKPAEKKPESPAAPGPDASDPK